MSSAGSWEIVPTNQLAGLLLGVLFAYLFFRQAQLILMVASFRFSWLRKFSWLSSENSRLKIAIHWIAALAIFLGFLMIASTVGWLRFVPI